MLSLLCFFQFFELHCMHSHHTIRACTSTNLVDLSNETYRMSQSKDNNSPRTALTHVEKAKSGKGHCLFCDTRIEKDSPRVVWHLYHSAGSYSRNNGAATGYTAGGWLDMYAHPQCCFHWKILEDRSTKLFTCGVCDTTITDSRCVQTITASGGKRCRRSPNRSPMVHCFPCVRQFLMTHRDLLHHSISPRQRQVAVPWAPPKSIFDPQPSDTWHLQRNSQIRQEYLALFDLSNDDPLQEDNENQDSFVAMERQERLKEQIQSALQADRKRKVDIGSPPYKKRK